ncbi:MAG: hypothetical protein K0S33_4120 [Bacteroidetes bacterium]|jgi:hypothetical protein|nr:hypothetical protein [Bacteroidota bacterium]
MARRKIQDAPDSYRERKTTKSLRTLRLCVSHISWGCDTYKLSRKQPVAKPRDMKPKIKNYICWVPYLRAA